MCFGINSKTNNDIISITLQPKDQIALAIHNNIFVFFSTTAAEGFIGIISSNGYINLVGGSTESVIFRYDSSIATVTNNVGWPVDFTFICRNVREWIIP